MGQTDQTIRANLFAVQEKIARAAQTSGRNPSEVKLVVVTKGQPVEVIQEAIQAGARLFGENYPEQAEEKILALKDADQIQWHMIGHLQSRKANIVCNHFDMLHSLDRLDLALKLEKLLAAAGKTLPVLLEFNLAGEESKSGMRVGDEAEWDRLLPDVEQFLSLAHIQVKGLMTMPPLFDDTEKVRPYFTQLAHLCDFLRTHFHGANLDELSMGTSADYEVAVQEGATYVRVGTAILGPRPPKLV